MANTPSAKKATRKIARRTAVNKNRRSRVRTFLRKVEEALAAGDKSAAQAAFTAAQPELMRAASKGVLHRNTASRKVSRLAQRLKSLNARFRLIGYENKAWRSRRAFFRLPTDKSCLHRDGAFLRDYFCRRRRTKLTRQVELPARPVFKPAENNLLKQHFADG